MAMKRGDIVVTASPGEFGKPRPALIVQSDLFNPTHASFVICPITSHLFDAPLFRLAVSPSPGNGLKKESQLMVDKLTAVNGERISKKIGQLDAVQMARVSDALRLWLELS